IETSSGTLLAGCKSSVIPKDGSVTSIGRYAFYDCIGLTSITIPDSVTSIGERAFFGCWGLKSITIPDSVTSIGEGAFSSCIGLTSIIVEHGNSVYHSAGNCLIETSSGTLLAGCKSSVIPKDGSVTSIGRYAFYDCIGLTSITIPDSVTSIGYEAFYGCWGLKSITIPDSVTYIGGYVFYHCRGLISINYMGTMEQWSEIEKKDDWRDGYDTADFTITCTDGELDKDDNQIGFIIEDGVLKEYKGNAFKLVIPDGVISIGEDAFYGCSSLISITISGSVTRIEDWAFSDCSGLTSITISSNVTSVGARAFEGCDSLKNIIFIGTREQWNKIGYETKIPVTCVRDTSTGSMI
ncbi:MAG TPA: leucine-rich repeat domain-containing protein, partial [Firmicutes bacterium]|nr:leucine-rich repeat domain-containing protein [Bacillota bacterium]